MDNETNGKEVKIAVLKEQMKNVQSDVTEIKTNHLPHIYDALGNIKDQITEVRISFARYIGMGIGAIAVLDILIRVIFGK